MVETEAFYLEMRILKFWMFTVKVTSRFKSWSSWLWHHAVMWWDTTMFQRTLLLPPSGWRWRQQSVPHPEDRANSVFEWLVSYYNPEDHNLNQFSNRKP